MAVFTFLFFLFASPFETLTGTILDQSGVAVSAARVEVSAPGFSRSVTTDQTGAFLIDEVPVLARARVDLDQSEALVPTVCLRNHHGVCR